MKKSIVSIVFVIALAISAHAQTADQHFKAGLEFYNKKAYDQAITSFSAAISLNPNMPAAWFNRGQSYFYKGLFDKAIVEYSQALKLKPDMTDCYFSGDSLTARSRIMTLRLPIIRRGSGWPRLIHSFGITGRSLM